MSEVLFDPDTGPDTGAADPAARGRIPAEGIPAEGIPAEGIPAEGIPVEGIPVEGIPVGVDGLDPEAALVEAVRLRQGADAAEARLLRVAAHWADLHAVLPDDRIDGGAAGARTHTVVGGTERLVPLAGPGAPAVAEFAPVELAAALGMSARAGETLVGNALELRHRLPRLWGRVMAGQLPAWRAGKIAEHTKTLPAEAAAFVDAQLAPVAHRIGLGRVLALVEAALKRFDPDAAAEQEQRAAETRGVWLGQRMLHGTRSIHIEADALDAEAFDHTLTDLAAALAAFGDPDTLDVRRAKAIGTIADPQTALDLLTADPDNDTRVPGEDTNEQAHGEPAGDRPGNSYRSRAAARKPKVAMYVHLHQDAIEAGSGVGRVEGLGAVTIAKIAEWLGRAEVSVTGVLDLDSRVAVDGYETPARIRETVLLRNPCCPFPWCPNLSRVKDIDHIDDYVPPEHGGTPGQTGPDKLAGLCRRHHRCKTHGGWTYTMPEPGLYLWRSPHGRRYLVDHTGTTPIDTT